MINQYLRYLLAKAFANSEFVRQMAHLFTAHRLTEQKLVRVRYCPANAERERLTAPVSDRTDNNLCYQRR